MYFLNKSNHFVVRIDLCLLDLSTEKLLYESIIYFLFNICIVPIHRAKEGSWPTIYITGARDRRRNVVF